MRCFEFNINAGPASFYARMCPNIKQFAWKSEGWRLCVIADGIFREAPV